MKVPRIIWLLALALLLPAAARANTYAEPPIFEQYYHTWFGVVSVVGFQSSTLIYRLNGGWPRYISIPLPYYTLPLVPAVGCVGLLGGWWLIARRGSRTRTH